jgi:hypothetical protein
VICWKLTASHSTGGAPPLPHLFRRLALPYGGYDMSPPPPAVPYLKSHRLSHPNSCRCHILTSAAIIGGEFSQTRQLPSYPWHSLRCTRRLAGTKSRFRTNRAICRKRPGSFMIGWYFVGGFSLYGPEFLAPLGILFAFQPLGGLMARRGFVKQCQ